VRLLLALRPHAAAALLQVDSAISELENLRRRQEQDEAAAAAAAKAADAARAEARRLRCAEVLDESLQLLCWLAGCRCCRRCCCRRCSAAGAAPT
jgi:hypothetical protein